MTAPARTASTPRKSYWFIANGVFAHVSPHAGGYIKITFVDGYFVELTTQPALSLAWQIVKWAVIARIRALKQGEG